MLKNIELQAPARDLDMLKAAINAGADAVYIGGESYGMKTSYKDFSKLDMSLLDDKNMFYTISDKPYLDDLLNQLSNLNKHENSHVNNPEKFEKIKYHSISSDLKCFYL